MFKKHSELILVVSLTAAYFATGKLGLHAAFVHPSSTAVWPPTGLAIAALLLFGTRVWPAIFLGAFFVNITTVGTAATSLGIAAGNTCEALLAAYLVTRFAKGRRAFDGGIDTFTYALFVAASTVIAATAGTLSLSLGGFAAWHDFKYIWITWSLGDAAGGIVCGPLLLLCGLPSVVQWTVKRAVEGVALLIGLVTISAAVFFLPASRGYPIEYLCVPFLAWAALRFGQREAAAASALLSAVAVWGTLRGFGPFAVGSRNASLLLLQAFVGIISVMTLALAAMTAERRRSEEQVRSLAVTDPLTGLANYRMLTDVIDAEIRRFDRTGRPFALLMLDLDGLKKINDKHGHLTGSQALCRLADVLRAHCRSIDTAARYGGDEFAVVLAEVELEEALRVAVRIRERLAEDRGEPALSVSVGIAAFPEDAARREDLIAAADRSLYEMKRGTRHISMPQGTSKMARRDWREW